MGMKMADRGKRGIGAREGIEIGDVVKKYNFTKNGFSGKRDLCHGNGIARSDTPGILRHVMMRRSYVWAVRLGEFPACGRRWLGN